jgi:hypothetical protein
VSAFTPLPHPLQFSTATSAINTLLAVYTGTTVNALLLVGSNDDCGVLATSCVTINLPASASPTTFAVQVDGKLGASGNVALSGSVVVAPPNDVFTAPVTTFPASGTSAGATVEAGEPSAGPGGAASVWYQYTAAASAVAVTIVVSAATPTPSHPCVHHPRRPCTGVPSLPILGLPHHRGSPLGTDSALVCPLLVPVQTQVSTGGSSFDTLLAVYTGASVGALTLVTSNDDCGGLTTSCTTFIVLPSATLRVFSIQVQGKNGASGPVTVAVAITLGPTNDVFASPVTTLPATGTNVGGTLEVNEPSVVGGAGASVWYQYTAPASSVAITVTVSNQLGSGAGRLCDLAPEWAPCHLTRSPYLALTSKSPLHSTVPASVASYTLIPAPIALPPGAAEIEITTQLLIWPRRNAVSSPPLVDSTAAPIAYADRLLASSLATMFAPQSLPLLPFVLRHTSPW